MASCKVVWRTSAERELRKLPREIIADMVELASKLANDPFPHGRLQRPNLLGFCEPYSIRRNDNCALGGLRPAKCCNRPKRFCKRFI